MPFQGLCPLVLPVSGPLFSTRMLSKVCGTTSPSTGPCADTTRVSEGFCREADGHTLSAPQSASLSLPPRRRRHPELLRFGTEAWTGWQWAGSLRPSFLPQEELRPHHQAALFSVFSNSPTWRQTWLAFPRAPSSSIAS